MKKIVLSLIILLSFFSVSAANASGLINHDLQPETLHYKVMFKWGLVNKQAGRATLSLKRGTDYYISQLTARSESWADKFFCVRDTLNGHMSYDGFTPLYYEKIAHEGNEDKHDKVIYDYSAEGLVKAECYRKEVRKGELKVEETVEREALGAAVDMLSSFYFMRTLPFEMWEPGHVEKIDIFSGKQKELLTIKYRGIETIEVDGKHVASYHITFIFTSRGGKKSSDDMDAWISSDSARVPLLLEGKLPVGKVQCFLTSK